jgi:hypothetical protein
MPLSDDIVRSTAALLGKGYDLLLEFRITT